MKMFSTRTIVIFIYAAAFFLARFSFASECKELGDELDSMRKAQHQIMSSLVKNHYEFSDSLEFIIQDLSVSEQKISRSSIKGLKKIAQAYRSRGEKGQSISEKLDSASADLIARIKRCLK